MISFHWVTEKWKGKHIIAQWRVTPELNHIIGQQRLLLTKKERQIKTLHLSVTGQVAILFQPKVNSLCSFSSWGSWHFMPQQYLSKPVFFSAKGKTNTLPFHSSVNSSVSLSHKQQKMCFVLYFYFKYLFLFVKTSTFWSITVKYIFFFFRLGIHKASTQNLYNSNFTFYVGKFTPCSGF